MASAPPTYTDAQRAEGVTKARLAANASRPSNQQFAADADYTAFVCNAAGIATLPTTAADSYAGQYASQTVAQLQTALDAALAAKAVPPAPTPPPPPLPADALAAAKVTAIQSVDGLFAAKTMVKGSAVCDTPSGSANCDLTSRTSITGAVVMAMIADKNAQPFSINWTMANNTTVTLNSTQMIALGEAVGQYVSKAADNRQALKVQINAATTPAAVSAVDVTVGWPVHG